VSSCRTATLLAIAAAAVLATGCPRSGSKRPRAKPVAQLSASAYAHYLRGRVFMYEGDYQPAVAQFRKAVRAAPEEATIRVSLLEALFRNGQRATARRCAEQAQKRFPSDAGVWLISGRIYYSVGLMDEARKAFARAVDLEPGDERAYLGLATSLLKLDRPRKAEKAYRRLLAAVPDSVAGNYRLATQLMARGAHREAERYLRRTLEVDSDHIKARVALARAAHALGKKQQSIAMLRNAFDRSGGAPEVGEELFRQLLEAGDRRGGLALLGVIDRDDLDTETRVAFGYLYLQAGDPAAAAELASNIRESEPRSGDVELLRSNALVDLRRDEEATRILLGVPPERPAFPECRALAAELLARAGETGRALTTVEEARARHPDNLALINSHALVHELRKDPAQARKVFDTALGKRPGDPDLLYAYGELEDRLGKPKRAISLVEQVLAKEPSNSHAMNFIGYSLAERNVDLRRARRLLERAMELAPWSAYVLDSYGWLLYREQRLDEAVQVLQRAARLAPAEAEILFHLGELYRARKDARRALKLLEKARSTARHGPLYDRIEARIRELRSDK